MSDKERLDWLERELRRDGTITIELHSGQPALNQPAKLSMFTVSSQWVNISDKASLRDLVDSCIERAAAIRGGGGFRKWADGRRWNK